MTEIKGNKAVEDAAVAWVMELEHQASQAGSRVWLTFLNKCMARRYRH